MAELFTEEDVRNLADDLYTAAQGHGDAPATFEDYLTIASGALAHLANAGRLRLPASGHPEDRCHRCGGPNVIWSAPSPLWNQIMRDGSINGADAFDGIVCPVCFAQLAEGVATTWSLTADRVLVELETVTPSGRVWNETVGRWLEGDENSDLRTLTELERIHGFKLDAILPDGTHRYWSTHCRHGNHEACSASEMSGVDARRPGEWTTTIKRTPSSCKTCQAPCVCTCHQEGATE